MKSIAFIVPYFGKFNGYFQLWLNSCANNPTVDWFIFTDDEREFNYPPNVHVSYTTLGEMKIRIERTFNVNISLTNAYKLCDIKPLYGKVFAKELENFDFWGYCDIDLIWGNIRKFATDDILTYASKVFSFGHCTLMRNTCEVNNYFHRNMPIGIANWEKVIKEPYSFLYDEAHQINRVFKIFFSDTFHEGLECFDANVNSRSLKPTQIQRKIQKGIYNSSYIFSYDNGILVGMCVNKNRLITKEFMYIHLQKRKMIVKVCSDQEKYLILHDRFMNYAKVDKFNFKSFLPGFHFLPYRWKEQINKVINVIFDSGYPKLYFRSRHRYIIDFLFRRTTKYEYIK